MDGKEDPERADALEQFKNKLLELREMEAKLKTLRIDIKGLQKDFDTTEDNIKALQSVGQIIGEVLKQLDEERCEFTIPSTPSLPYADMSKHSHRQSFIWSSICCRLPVKGRHGKAEARHPCRSRYDNTYHNADATPRSRPTRLQYVFGRSWPGQLRRHWWIERADTRATRSHRIAAQEPRAVLEGGYQATKGCASLRPPRHRQDTTGKSCGKWSGNKFPQRHVTLSIVEPLHPLTDVLVVSSAIVDKYIGESARLIREMFGYAKEHEPCIIFMDEIDAIGGRRFSEGTSADREIQRTLMELLNQLDGFDYLGKTKIIMATNRPDTLDPALLRAGRLDRKIEIPLPNEVGRLEILKIHTSGVALDGEIDFESVVKMSDQLNGADLRNVVTEA